MKKYNNDKECRKRALVEFLATQKFEVGDVIFTRLPLPIFREIAELSSSWTNHIAVVVDATPGAEIVAESTFPRSVTTPLLQHVWRSDHERFVVIRPKKPLTESQRERIVAAAEERLGRFYQIWFNMNTKMQYCSKFVHEVYREGGGRIIGTVETPRDILKRNPEGPVWLFRLWFLGFIPWNRKMITPASILQDNSFKQVCEYQWEIEK